jgi:uncharacterized protein (DUF1015 family)|nr:DUF1015 domain-containing protein [Thermoanaerobacterales bacterium]
MVAAGAGGPPGGAARGGPGTRGGPGVCQDGRVARFQPFRALRYDLDRVDLARVIAPPYDVIDDRLRAELAARDPHNAVRVDLPVPDGARDRYEVASCLLRDWRREGVLVTDERPTFTVHRMAYVDDAGVARHTTGVLGALELTPPGTDILPHEHTTPKARSDRLDMLRSCKANTSAIWGLSLAKGLTALLPDGPPYAQVVDSDGVEHTLWVVDDPEACAAIAEAVAAHPVVIADGHHRYETSLAYRREREAAGDPGAAAATLAYVVELVEDELTVRAIHRLVDGLPTDRDPVALLEPWFEPLGPPPAGVPVTTAMQEAGALCAVTPAGEVLLRPRSDALADTRDLDSARLDVALAALGGPEVRYQHGVDNVRAAVAEGRAQLGVLLRPATIAQIEATAHGGERMPPKTTFFHPKPPTGLVFRDLA